MIRLPNDTLSPRAKKWLSRWQADLYRLGTFEAKTAAVEAHWASRNRATNQTFTEVRATLQRLCSGALGCPYCETSVGKTIDHFRPKALYPDQAYSWDNFVPACSDCQTVKGNQFRIRRHDTHVCEDLSLRTEPSVGDPILLNPRWEEPSSYLEIDLETGEFLELWGLNVEDQERANYTIHLLQLNRRNELQRARRGAYHDFQLRLREYADLKEAGDPQAELQLLREALLMANYQAVWEEMKRQVRLYPDSYPKLVALFGRVPEALEWHWHEVVSKTDP